MRRRGLILAALIAMGTVSPGCSADGPRRDILDGKSRVPDDEGIATELTFRTITLDGTRTYDVSEDLIAFDTYNLQLEPLLRRRGQYVHIGLDGDAMEWMAGISGVVRAGDLLLASYSGVITQVEAGRIHFRDGTVLQLGADVEPPAPGTFVEVDIDAARHEAVALTPRTR